MKIDRRKLLGMLGGSGAAAFGAVVAGDGVRAAPKLSGDPFALGVAAGDPAPDGFVIWTRLAPRPLEVGGGMPRRGVEVSWEIASDEAMHRSIARGTTTAHPESCHCVHVEVQGLGAGREYYYRFEADGVRSPVGRAKTMPAAGQEGEVRFASAGCQRFEDGYFTAWRKIADERLDFVIHYGDYIYEYKAIEASAGRDPPVVRSMPGNPGKCRTLEDFRNRYAIYKLDKDLQAAHASTAFLMSFDDHEVENNWAGFHSEYETSGGKAFALRRAAAFQAWYEHMPLRRSQMPKGPDVLAYRRLLIGDLLQVDILDTRQYRSPPACGNGWKVCADAKDSGRTILGQAQESWLYEGFRHSTAQWNVLAQQIPVARMSRNRDRAIIETHMDKWDGAEAARGRLFDALASAKLRNTVILAGDVHHNRAAELHRNFDVVTAPPVAVEFVATSIASGGDGSNARKKAARLMSANPHLRFYNEKRGYVRHTVSRSNWRADCVTFNKVSVPNSPAKVVASFVVEPGIARLARG